MRQLNDIVLKRTEYSDDEEEEYWAASSLDSDDSPAPSFKSISFGKEEEEEDKHPKSSNMTITTGNEQEKPEVAEADDHDHEEEVMQHPLDGSGPGITPTTSYATEMEVKFNRRRERLNAVRQAFLAHHHTTVHPYFAQKRHSSASRSGLWGWLPSFGIGGTATPGGATTSSPEVGKRN